MKNSLKLLIFIFNFFIFFNFSLIAEEIEFQSKEITVFESKNLIEAKNGKAISQIHNLTINAKKFNYFKEKQLLEGDEANAFLEDQNLKLKSKKLIYNKQKGLVLANGNVEGKDLLNNILFKSESLTLDLNSSILKSNTKTRIVDQFLNTYEVSNFEYNFINNKVKLKNLFFKDINNNVLNSELAYLDLNINKLLGKDLKIKLNNQNFNSENEPRLKGRSFSISEKITKVNKASFTLCKKNDKCPPWILNAENIKHDSKKKTIFYDNAWLKVYDMPVFYFPKFFHPDPSVKRQSGFLMPKFEGSKNNGSALHTPYYHVISENKDLTLYPRFYKLDKMLLQSEYREVKRNTKTDIDASILRDKDSNKTHFFLNHKLNLDLNLFKESNTSVKLERTTNDTYLKKYKIKSPIIKNQNNLENSIEFNGANDDLIFETNFYVFEDLTKNESDRYQYVYPSFSVEKSINSLENLNGDLTLKSRGSLKEYDTNVKEQILINDLLFESTPIISNFGFKTNNNLLIKNTNTNSKKSKKYKSHDDYKLSSLFETNTSLPLVKKYSNSEHFLNPKISLRYSPNQTKNIRNNDNRIDISNIYSLNRISSGETLESGGSMTYGVDYSNSVNGREIFHSNVANIIRTKENKDLPINSKLGKKTSDIVGSLYFSPTQNLKFDYDFSLDENLSEQNYQFFKSELSINKLVTSFEYLEEKNTTNKEHYWSNKTSYNFDDMNKLSYATRRNKKTKLTEFYSLIYEYQNDCLKASLEYNKDYYSDRDLRPEENLFFKITIIPFAESSSPNLK